MRLEYETNAKDVEKFLKRYEEKILRTASVKTINQSLSKMIPHIKKGVTESLKIPAKLQKNRVKIPRGGKANARKNPYQGRVWVSINNFPAYKNATANQQKGAHPNGVKWRGGRDVNGFVQTMRSGKTSFFRRKTPARLPIKLITIDTVQASKRAGYLAMAKAKKSYEQRMAENLIKETQREIRRQGLN